MEAVQKWPISRLFLASCPDEVARATADRLGDRRSLAPILFRWPGEASRPLESLGTAVNDGLGSLRPSE
jgi:hypothetical protein